MPKYVDFDEEHKSKHDSRIEFGKTLVDLLRGILRKSTTYFDKNGVENDLRFKMWANGLRNYYSMTFTFMPKVERDIIKLKLDRLLDIIERYRTYIKHLTPNEREKFPIQLRKDLFELQDQMYGKTIHLLTPINNDDDDDMIDDDFASKTFG